MDFAISGLHERGQPVLVRRFNSLRLIQEPIRKLIIAQPDSMSPNETRPQNGQTKWRRRESNPEDDCHSALENKGALASQDGLAAD